MKRFAAMMLTMGLTVALTWFACSIAKPVFAEEEAVAVHESKAEPMEVTISEKQNEYGLLAIGVGLAMLGGAIGTGLAQKGIGTAVVAACSENKSFLGIGVFLLALPETILIIATGIAYLLLQNIK